MNTINENSVQLSFNVIGAAIEVHKALGPGLLESVYESCLAKELFYRGIKFQRQLELPVYYKGEKLDCEYRIDLMIEDSLILELKSVEKILPIHEAQLLTYLRLSQKKVGLIINFNTPVLINGVKRIVC